MVADLHVDLATGPPCARWSTRRRPPAMRSRPTATGSGSSPTRRSSRRCWRSPKAGPGMRWPCCPVDDKEVDIRFHVAFLGAAASRALGDRRGGETLARAGPPPRACAGGCTRPLRRAALAAGRRGRTQRRRRDGPRRIHARRRARAGPLGRAAAPRPRGFAALIPGRRKAALAPGHAPSGDAAAGCNAFNALSTPGFLS